MPLDGFGKDGSDGVGASQSLNVLCDSLVGRRCERTNRHCDDFSSAFGIHDQLLIVLFLLVVVVILLLMTTIDSLVLVFCRTASQWQRAVVGRVEVVLSCVPPRFPGPRPRPPCVVAAFYYVRIR